MCTYWVYFSLPDPETKQKANIFISVNTRNILSAVNWNALWVILMVNGGSDLDSAWNSMSIGVLCVIELPGELISINEKHLIFLVYYKSLSQFYSIRFSIMYYDLNLQDNESMMVLIVHNKVL